MKAFAKILSFIIIGLTVLSVFGYLAIKSTDENAGDGSVSKVIRQLVTFPETVTEVLESNEIRNIPPTFGMKHYFDPINKLEKDVFGLNSYFIQDSNHWEIRLFNFRTDSLIHRWVLGSERFKETGRHFTNSEPRNCILMPNRGLILGNDETPNLFRLDRNSNVLWENHDVVIHHSLNLDADSNLLVCTTKHREFTVPTKEGPVFYEDELIAKINSSTGDVVYEKSISEILIKNNLRSLIYGFSSKVAVQFNDDPLHLNDIQPIMTDGPFWKKDDLLLSFRHLSMIMLYRPATDKIHRLIFGPFLRQHDVDILSDSVISIFNNEGTALGKKVFEKYVEGTVLEDSINYSNIIHYNFSDSTFSTKLKHHFDAEKIFTDSQGFHEYLSDGSTYVENHGPGIVYIMNEEEIIYKSQMNNWIDDWVERPHWIRIYENVDF